MAEAPLYSTVIILLAKVIILLAKVIVLLAVDHIGYGNLCLFLVMLCDSILAIISLRDAFICLCSSLFLMVTCVGLAQNIL